MILKNGKFKDVTVDCEMGNLEIDGTLAGDFNADCAMGNLTVNFAGNKADYNYELSCNMGNLEVNGGTYNGRDFYEKNEAQSELSHWIAIWGM